MHRTDFTVFDDPAVAMAHKSAVRSIERVVHETVPATPPQEALERTLSQLQNPKNLVITGASVSTGAGIPDYRSKNGRLTGLVTQNVDGLHSQAGSRNVIALHGDMDHVVCLDCHTLHERLKPNVVYFGENVPRARRAQADTVWRTEVGEALDEILDGMGL
ncbi:Sir2 family NAD-dependent protein deacetylase [Corynebacterium sp. HMSC29G08]|uniref:Sir2 family NAD-dependent protein deacetylase n=1 Tax=Corynebacterium sp. HMSC29G08 TaxID=1581069 RepID=UPI0008A2F870|nr:Sir2 family NAD-dependent protein deacetylase [Corynebacterium sp. HMSC29G08]OFT84020.1 hypothetical protein HMPREF3101_05055 [Corynebacterium sp. HMSC29G08]